MERETVLIEEKAPNYKDVSSPKSIYKFNTITITFIYRRVFLET